MSENISSSIFSLRKAPGAVIIFLLVFYFGSNFIHQNWKMDEGPIRGVIKWDIISYYGYLPAVFIHHDITLEFVEGTNFRKDGKFWYEETEIGKKVIITSMGMSYLYSPFFFMAHVLAPVFNETRDGFSSIYQFFLVFSALFYLALGLYCLWKLLSKYFLPGPTALSMLLIGIGTNLYYYSTQEAALSHSYSFALISALFLVVTRWYARPDWKHSLLLGFLYGMIVLIRPSNILLGIPIIFWGVGSLDTLRERLQFLLKAAPMILIMLGGFLIPWIPQFLYWKEVAGVYIYNSYSGVGSSFYFGNPHIMDFLISYRKGWLVYTPLMLLAMLGFIPLYRNHRGLFYPLLVYMAIMIYVLSSWWSWWYGGSFGMRSAVDIYGLLALPLAALIMATRKLWLSGRIMIGVLFAFLVFLNIFQTYQYKAGLIHWVGMTKASYWTIFLRTQDRYGFWQNLTEPDYELARKGIYVFYPIIPNDRIKNMSEEDGRLYVTDEIRQDRSLVRDIKKYCRRTGSGKQETLDMLVDRVYQEKTR
ncbi:hypothetical protein ACFLTU_00765 [Bacteroidota bacterium]